MLGDRNCSELKACVVLGYGTEEGQFVSIEIISSMPDAKAAKALKLNKAKSLKKANPSPSHPLFVKVLSLTMGISIDSAYDSLA
ncbi:hypothetical protein PanWU01x14_183970 [Parasponia andersonii]|uniref:Uncharacterized protein n=1 Tax=Parasponia andersonii TaxID=3476 RepID=A0A2P5C4V1_PARAD|nr:hypothetical protein PanWU01x14_183970 [Parasponia andersonii]